MDRGERERRERLVVGLALNEENSSKPSTACHATSPHSSAALRWVLPPLLVSVSHDLAVRRVGHPREPRLLPGQAARHAVEKANEDVEPNKVVRRHQDLQISAALGNVWFCAFDGSKKVSCCTARRGKRREGEEIAFAYLAEGSSRGGWG